MSTSDKTAQEVIRVILRYTTVNTAKAVIRDLSNVAGNKSYKETIAKLVKCLEENNRD